MKVCVVGAGAVGGLVAGGLGHRLGPQDLTLSVLARGETLAALQRDGLRVEQAGGPVVVQPIFASDQPEALGVQDLVVVAVKGPALGAVAPAVRALSGMTPLMLASIYGRVGIVRLLLERGANRHLPSHAGRTALDYAASHPLVLAALA